MKKIRLSALILLSNLVYSYGQNCEVPSYPVITADNSYCKGGNAILEANSSVDTFRWYDAQTNGNLIGTSSTLVLENLSTNRTVWVEAYQKDEVGITDNGARVQPSNLSGAAVSSASQPWGLRFTLQKDIVLNKVDVYLRNTTEATMTIQLQDANYNVLASKVVTVPVGNADNPIKHTIELNFSIPKGTNYSLVTPNGPNMVRETQAYHNGFPYMLGDAGMITQGMLQNTPTAVNSTTYYYFYNWKFTVFEDCVTQRAKKDIIVNDIPVKPSGDEKQNYTEGQTLADLDVEGLNLRWYADINKTEELESTSKVLNNFTYYVSQTIGGCESDLLKIVTEKTLGITEINQKTISIYPNPVESEFYLKGNLEKVEKIDLYGISGRKLKTFKSKDIYNVSSLTKGTYLITVYYENGKSVTSKFIKK